MMTAGSEVAKLVEGILANVKTSGSRELDSWRHPDRDIRRLARRDYTPSLRKPAESGGRGGCSPFRATDLSGSELQP